jgi:pilus assembly protein CpaB
LKRSNRLVLLVGVFLAVVAFVGILLISQGGGGGGGQAQPTQPTELPTVIATADIPLGTRIRADQVTTQSKAVTSRSADAFGDVSQVVGKIARQPVVTGGEITAATLSGKQGQILDIFTPPGLRSIAVQVDQVTGVGTVIKTGDYVDMVIGLQTDKFPVITVNPTDQSFTVVQGLNATSVKVLIQGLQVLGTLLPPPEETTSGEQPAPSGTPTTGGTTALTGQQEIVILAVDAQQAELIKFAQLDASITLVLRSPDDFIDPTTGAQLPVVPPTETTGVILKTLVDTYGVLPPELVETVLPAQATAAP